MKEPDYWEELTGAKARRERAIYVTCFVVALFMAVLSCL